MSEGTYTNEPYSKRVSIDEILETVKQLRALPKPAPQWILVDPDGHMHIGEVEAITRILLRHHPLMKLPPREPT